MSTAPCRSAGTVTVTDEIGSSTTVPASASAAFTPIDAAVRNAISDESTECDLPSSSSTRTSTTGCPCGPPPASASRAPLDGGDVRRGTEPPVTESTNSNPSPGGSGESRSCTTANWPWPPDCFLSLPSTWAEPGDRLAVRDRCRTRRHVHAEHAGEALDRDRDVRVAEAAQDRLVAGAVDDERRVLRRRAARARPTASRRRTARPGSSVTAKTGARRGSAAGRAVPLARDQSSEPDGDPVELRDRADLAGRERADGQVLGPAQPEQPVDALVGAGRRVVQLVARAQHAREHLEHRDLPDERVGHGAEHVHEELAVGVRRDPVLGAAALAVGRAADDDAAVVLERRRRQLADEVGDAVDARAR